MKEKKKDILTAIDSLAYLTSMIGVSFNFIDQFIPFECRSLNENKILRVTERLGRQQVLIHHVSNMSRIYPKGNRFDSSNYSPIPGWAAGA